MKLKVINSVSPGTLGILSRKVEDKRIKDLIEQSKVGSVGLCQGNIADMLIASDIADKTSNVIVGEISGTCPQHIICIGIFGDTASVETALAAIESGLKKGENSCIKW